MASELQVPVMDTDRIINGTPVAKHFNTTTQQYETASLGADLTFYNGFEAP